MDASATALLTMRVASVKDASEEEPTYYMSLGVRPYDTSTFVLLSVTSFAAGRIRM